MLTYYRIFWKLELRRSWCKLIRDHKNRTIIEGRQNMAHCPDCGKVLSYVMVQAPKFKWM